MCLAVPGRIISICGENFARSGRVDFGGIVREVSLAYLPEAMLDDYVVVHAGIALALLDIPAAKELQNWLGVRHDPT